MESKKFSNRYPIRSKSISTDGIDERLSGSVEMACSSDCDAQYKQACDDITDLQNTVNDLSFTVNILKDLVIKQSNSLSYMSDKIVHLQRQSMKENVIITGVEESKDENPFDLAVDFIKNKVGVECYDEDIVKAHRVGISDSKSTSPRPLVVKMADEYQKDEVLSSSKNLKNKKNSKGKGYFISQQEPEKFVEEKKHFRFKLRKLHEANKAKAPGEKKDDIKVIDGKIIWNNEVQKPRVKVPSAEDLLQPVNDDENEKMRRIKMVSSDEKTDKGSRFQAFACQIKSVADVRRAYLKMKYKHCSAADVMCSYSLKYTNGRQIDEYYDDREHGGGSRIYSAIQSGEYTNCAVFVVRYFYGTHLGGKRFKYIKDCADEALKNLFQ